MISPLWTNIYSTFFYLGSAQIRSFVSHLWTLFISGVEILLDSLHPAHKLPYVLLVTGPLRQGPFQLTVGFTERHEHTVTHTPGTAQSTDGRDGFHLLHWMEAERRASQESLRSWICFWTTTTPSAEVFLCTDSPLVISIFSWISFS